MRVEVIINSAAFMVLSSFRGPVGAGQGAVPAGWSAPAVRHRAGADAAGAGVAPLPSTGPERIRDLWARNLRPPAVPRPGRVGGEEPSGAGGCAGRSSPRARRRPG